MIIQGSNECISVYFTSAKWSEDNLMEKWDKI